MKKILLAFVLLFFIDFSLSAVRYRGSVELSYGVYTPSKYYGLGGELGVSTSHGVEIDPGIFVGLGVDWLYGGYKEYSNYQRYNEIFALQNLFVEGRYSFFSQKNLSPFVGLRLGAGTGETELGSNLLHPYISPAVGYSFSFSRRCGIDVGVSYVFHGTNLVYVSYGEFPYESYSQRNGTAKLIKVVNSSVQFRVGLHF